MSLNPPQEYRKTEYTHRYGLAADKPAAGDVLKGTLYFSKDTLVLERSNGIIWESYSPAGGGGGGDDYVVMSDGGIPSALPINDGAGSFIYTPYIP